MVHKVAVSGFTSVVADAEADLSVDARVEEERRRGNERLRTAFEAARMLSWEAELDRGTITLSENAGDLLGLAHPLERLEDAFAQIHEDDRPLIEFALERAAQEGRSHDQRFRFIRPDNGEAIWLEWRSVTTQTTDTSLIVRGVALDITEIVCAEEALRVSEARYRTQFEAAPEAIVTLDVDSGFFVEVNDNAERLLGYSRDELMAVGPIEVSPELQPDGRASAVIARAYVEQTLQGGKPVFEWEHRFRSGALIPCEVRLVRLPDPSRNLCRGSIIDISDRKQAEAEQKRLAEALRNTEDRLRQAQKMEAIGRLAGGIAHDFNNLLSVVLSYSAMMIESLGSENPLTQDVKEIQSAGQRAADMTRQLLAFSRQQVLEPAVVDLNEIVRRMDAMLRRLIGEDIDLRAVTLDGIGMVKVDPGQIEQVVMNLVINARDAMLGGGTLTIETANVDLDESFPGTNVGVTPGPHVMLAVTDTGLGMSPEVQARIFEPFFTTKERAKGTGLGLSTVLGIVEQSGGTVVVRSVPNEGATFRVYFPRTQDLPAVPALAELPSTLHGTETILLVEDDEQLRALVELILDKHGYHVIVARDPADALVKCEQHAGTIHLLLTDVVMPRMNGCELATRATRIRPSMRVLYVSGYTDSATVQHGVLEDGFAFLQKPITPEALLCKLREILDADRSDIASGG